jgi:hypothetical protein
LSKGNRSEEEIDAELVRLVSLRAVAVKAFNDARSEIERIDDLRQQLEIEKETLCESKE